MFGFTTEAGYYASRVERVGNWYVIGQISVILGSIDAGLAGKASGHGAK
jgi:hypothetical protein